MQYTTRHANEEDILWLDSLRRAAYRDLFFATWGAWDEERHNRHFAACWELGNIKMIELNGNPVGMLQILESAAQLDILELQISASFQRQGLGTAILNDILTAAQQQNKKVALASGLKNLGAIKLYQNLGFIEIKRTEAKIYFEK